MLNGFIGLQDIGSTGYRSQELMCEYACRVISQEQRVTCRVLDVGAGTGLVARHVC